MTRGIVPLLACALVLCSGCATWKRHGIEIQRPRKIRIAVLPIQSDVQIRKLSDIYTVIRSSPPSTYESAEIAEKMAQARREIFLRLESRLRDSYLFDIVPATQTYAVLDGMRLAFSTAAYSQGQLQAIAKSLDAQAALVVRLSGYGRIKKKWVLYLVGSGFAEGAVQGAIVGTAAGGNAWVAAGVAVEETLQELLTWGGGAWLFNRVFTPVILEAELTSAADGQKVWREVSFARRDRKGLKRYPRQERAKKELRLRLTSEKAVDELVRELEKAAWKNIRAQE